MLEFNHFKHCEVDVELFDPLLGTSHPAELPAKSGEAVTILTTLRDYPVWIVVKPLQER